ncbi:MAG: hypothetical protein LBD08_08160 [Treponema sp.]|nr:hypothetical protein [Treponema sp.]
MLNGTDPCPDEQVLKLSSSFDDGASLGLSGPDRPALELEVRIININAGRNKALARKCRVLGEYAAFVAAEVFTMLITEWNLDGAKKAWFEEAAMETSVLTAPFIKREKTPIFGI